ncbi:MAG: HDOD domain-containing protein [Pseudomonadota bacterium]
MNTLPPIKIDPKTFLRQHCTLPALPQVIHRIQKTLQDDTASVTEMAELIGSDPGLVAQLLKVANSAYYSLPQEITKVQFAIAFLGLNEVYRMVLALSVVNILSIKEKDEIDRFWFHSFYAALCTKQLAKKSAPQLSFEELWSAAILHDIGKLVYLKFFPDHYHELRKCCKEHGCLFSQAEERLAYPSSSFMGTLLCDHWLLPVKIRDACHWHSLSELPKLQRDSTPPGDFRRMICLGNIIAELSNDELSTEVKRELADAIITTLKCTESNFLSLMGEMYDFKIETEEFIKKFN